MLDATQLYLGDWLSPLLTAEEEVYLRVAHCVRCRLLAAGMIESNLRLVVKLPAVMAIVVWRCWT